jgi:hypothetical protein
LCLDTLLGLALDNCMSIINIQNPVKNHLSKNTNLKQDKEEGNYISFIAGV